jgi:hypothetical protein
MGSVLMVPGLGLPVCCSSSLAYLEVEASASLPTDWTGSYWELGLVLKTIFLLSFWFPLFFSWNPVTLLCFSMLFLSLTLLYIVLLCHPNFYSWSMMEKASTLLSSCPGFFHGLIYLHTQCYKFTNMQGKTLYDTSL